MSRSTTFTVRLNTDEREAINALAQKMERTQGDVVRLLLRQRAAELGVKPSAAKESPRAANAPA
jgi:predicted transcriptional regulator